MNRDLMLKSPLPNESPRAFAAFKLYVQDGTKRSIRRCARTLRKSPTIIARWSKRNRWQKRLRELELEDCQRAVAADEQAKLNGAKELERERAEFRRRAIAASRRATERALKILEQPLGGSRPSDAARLLIAADTIGRAVLELTPTSGAKSSFGLNPAVTPIINVVVTKNPHGDQVRRKADAFFARNPDLKRPRNGFNDTAVE